ncbi:hypothetical protein [Paenibacillus sp. y28]|uniref:hypothetical protein n=1 Tax=Paenibacillus sp. y28 TaxID=3129110 RepID=UPI0030181B8E
MNSAAKRELQSILNELNVIRKELDQAVQELTGFKGIGAEYCLRRLEAISKQYSEIYRSLSRLQ